MTTLVIYFRPRGDVNDNKKSENKTDLVGPRHLRGPIGVTGFYSFHTIDMAGQTVSAHQFRDKRTLSLLAHLLDFWRFMGLPRASQMDNEMSASPKSSASISS